MLDFSQPLVLASGSPRRAQLLTDAGFTFEVRRPDIDEAPLPGEAPTDYVARLSAAKAIAVTGPGDIVIAADTTVDLDGQILEKPTDAADAARMLSSLGGRSHQTHTGVTVIGSRGATTRVVTTSVSFINLTDDMIEWYIGTGEPADKAGAYAIQGGAATFVERIDGSVSNVVGLPMAETLELIRNA